MTLERDPEPRPPRGGPAGRRGDPPPRPSLQPLLLAVGITIALIGVTTSWLVVIAGGLLILV